MTEIKKIPDASYIEPPQSKSAPVMSSPSYSAAAQEQVLLNKTSSTLTLDILTEILLSAGFKATEENIAMLKMLMDNGLPLTQENITRMNQALKLITTTANTPDGAQALFMVLNNMRLSPANAAQLEGVVSGTVSITHQINQVLQSINHLSDTALAARLTQILNGTIQINTTQTGTAQTNTMQTDATQINLAQANTTQINTTQTGASQTNATPNPSVNTAVPLQYPSQQPGTTLPQGQVVQHGTPSLPPGAANPVSQLTSTSHIPGTTPAPGTTQILETTQPLTTTVPDAPQTTQQTTQPTTTSLETQQPTQPTPLPGTPPNTPTQPTPLPGTPPNTPTQPTLLPGTHTTTLIQPNSSGTPGTEPSAAQNINTQINTLIPPNTASPHPATTLPTAPQHITTNPATPPQPTTTPSALLPPPLTLRINETTPAEIDRFLTHLREGLTQIRSFLSAQGTPASNTPEARVLQEVRTLANHIEFTIQIRNQLYVQFPLEYNGHQTQTALHIFKDAKKQADGKKDTASALVALDTAALGHFEAYLQKSNTSVHCQFRLISPAIEQLVRDNIHQLEALLQIHGYSLSSFAFTAAGKPYTLLDSPALFDEGFQIPHPENALPRFDKRA